MVNPGGVRGSVAAAGAPSAAEPPFSPSPIEEMVRAMVKAMRAHQLYLPNNPMHQRAIDACIATFAPVWKLTSEVALAVTESELLWHGHTVLVEPDKASDSLPWLLYKDGIRSIQFLSGFDQEELIRLLDIIQRVRRASPDEDDLITLLWEQDFSCLRYQYVELVSDNYVGIEASPFENRAVDTQSVASDAAAAADSGIVSMSDFDTTLYFMDAAEINYLQNEVAREYDADLRTNVAAILLDIFEAQADDQVRSELLELVDYYMIHHLANRSFGAVAYLLRESAEAAERARGLTNTHRETLLRVPDRLSEKGVLLELLHALDDSDELPAASDLAALFSQLRGHALGVILGWLAASQNQGVRPLLETAADRLAASNTAELVKLINADDADVRIEAMRRSGALRTQAAVAPLTRAVADPDPTIRLEAAIALSSIGSTGAMQILERCVKDSSRDVRVAAVRALAAQTFRPALQQVEGAIKGKQIRDADLTEKMAFYEAYGVLAGEQGIQYLDSVLNGKGLFGKKEDAETRACAAMALGRIGTDRALAALQKASGERDVIVRNAVNRAFRGGGA